MTCFCCDDWYWAILGVRWCWGRQPDYAQASPLSPLMASSLDQPFTLEKTIRFSSKSSTMSNITFPFTGEFPQNHILCGVMEYDNSQSHEHNVGGIGMESGNSELAGLMDLHTSHNVRFNRGKATCTTSPSLAKEARSSGMLIFSGLEPLSMVPLSSCRSLVCLIHSLHLTKKLSLCLVWTSKVHYFSFLSF